MADSIPFRRRSLATLMAVTCGGLPGVGFAVTKAAQIDFVAGDVTVTAHDGQRRPLAKGAVVLVGDTVETNAGRAWLRFTDGGYMSLQPGTEFRIDDYHFAGEEDGNERTFLSLLKGGIRAVTGAIGHRNRDNYRVNTPVATIGIRGTEYLATLGNSLTVTCGAGICVVTNEKGEVVLQAGQTVYVKDQNTEGELATGKVELPPAPPVEFRGPEDRDTYGNPSAIVVPPEPEPDSLQSGPGYYIAASFPGDGGEFTTLLETGSSPDFVTATFNDDTELERYEASFGARGTAGFADTSADTIIAWGRWTGGQTDGDSFPHPESLDQGEQSFHYVIGKPAPTDQIQRDVIATYGLLGATTPTFSDDGAEGMGEFGTVNSVTGSLVANFSDSTVVTSLQLDFTQRDLEISTDPLSIQPNATFGGIGVWAEDSFSNSHFAFIQGFFAGANAERAGVAYSVFINSSPDYDINGVAAFTKTGEVAVPPEL